MRECRTCKKEIPNKIIINGMQKILRNRKFCLECSPFGSKNTSKYDGVKRQPKKWAECSEARKEMIVLSLYKRGLERKTKLIENAGGKCKLCGYNKNRRALSFHHLDRKDKLFCLTLNNLWSKSWEILLTEANKCDLLCLNCHAEIEDGLSGKNIVDKVNKKYGTSF